MKKLIDWLINFRPITPLYLTGLGLQLIENANQDFKQKMEEIEASQIKPLLLTLTDQSPMNLEPGTLEHYKARFPHLSEEDIRHVQRSYCERAIREMAAAKGISTSDIYDKLKTELDGDANKDTFFALQVQMIITQSEMERELEILNDAVKPQPGSMEYCKTRFPPQPPIHFEMEPDVEEIAKANTRLEWKLEHNEYFSSEMRVDNLHRKILELLGNNPTLQQKLEFLQALSMIEFRLNREIVRDTIRENTSTEVD